MNLPFIKPKKHPDTDSISNPPSTGAGQLTPGLVSVPDIIAPPAIEVDFNHLKIGNTYFRSLFVAGYPRFVNANWLAPLINFNHSLDIAMFTYPVEGKGILDELRRKITEMEAEMQSDLKRGRLPQIHTQVALEDAKSLQEQLAKGAERFFQFGLYLTIPASSEDDLNTITKQVTSTLGSLLIVAKPATLQIEEGFKNTTPTGADYLLITRNMDTTSLATTFPFTSSELTANEGILYGINEHNDSLILFDRFTMPNANTVIFGTSGSGKSIFGRDKTLFDDGSGLKVKDIGPLIESLIARQGAQKIDTDIEGVVNPKLKVWTFNQSLQGQWANVTIAARKKFSPRSHLYTITTKSGRQITITADHNLVVLRQGKIRVMRSQAIKAGEAVPIPRSLLITSTITLPQELLTLLGLITSEGYATSKTVEIYNTDLQVLKIIKGCASKLGYQVSPRYNYPRRDIQGYHVLSTSFAKECFLRGVCGRSGEKRVPSAIFSLSNKQVSDYLRAYYEGDGGVERHEVTTTTKSKSLGSDLAYLLLRFGIIARIKPKLKSATNTLNKTKTTYYRVSISGKEQLEKFANQIGFLTETKNSKLKKLLESIPAGNTNVDTIPTLGPIFKYLYNTLYPTSEIKAPQIIIDIKNGEYNPSRDQLLESIKLCQERIFQLCSLNSHIQLLRNLPPISKLIEIGKRNRKLNSLLWKQLGQSWRVMKQYLHPPLAKNVLVVYSTITGHPITIPQVSQALYTSFKEQGVSLQGYNKSTWSSVVNRKGNSKYSSLAKAASFIARQYRSTQLKIRHAQEKLAQLKQIANSNLFWDPIVKIERIKHREKYVYDLQVDNGVFLAGDGGLFVHNSYLAKLEVIRSIMFDTEVIVIDPEDEYRTLCQASAGEYIDFSFSSTAKINPFDLSSVYEEGENELGLKVISLHGLLKVMLGAMSPQEEATLDQALIATYKGKGITPDPATQKNEPPLMEDLYKTLIGMEHQVALTLSARLEKFVKGSFRGLFDQHSNVDIKSHLTVFGIKELEADLRPIAMHIILDYIWTKIRRDLKKRLLVVDEAWYLMKYPDSATFLYSIAKRARKYYLGLTTITQDVEDFLTSDYGKAIITNSAIQLLMKQSTAAIDKLTEVFYLSQGERHLLLSADVGEGIFFAGQNHVAIRVVASSQEHQLVTSKPQELLKMRQQVSPATS
ncbi:MAG: hypothetical protein HY381_01680 [Candidatus Chisholmbacteria bacterium]|nr:hypothetical protein [Candidatus Chisholmbacteria bacterium]